MRFFLCEKQMQIKEEFKKLIPPLSVEEKRQLESNIIADGCREPLVLWVDILIDGHNRYEICVRLNIEFKTISKDFENESAVKLWMIDNQRGRRNLTDGWKFELAQVKKAVLSEIGKITQGKRTDLLSTIDNDFKEPTQKHNTQAEIAKDLGWSTGKVGMADVVFKEAETKPELKEKILAGNVSINEAYKEIKKAEKTEKLEVKKAAIIEETKASIEDNRPIVYCESFEKTLKRVEDNSIDLLITDPPYSTDVDDINGFAESWVLAALEKIKPTGRGYIFIGAYPKEINAYLNILLSQDKFIIDNPLIWTYRNTLGITPKNKYNLNYQVALHFYSKDSPELDTSITNEMFSVQDINAPDGRQGDRYHTWQKPEELARRLITHSTKEGDKIMDLFSCTGTFSIVASKLKRDSIACDISKENLLIAESRGCDVKF